jgi:alkanesulfonate monooxygenase SsuD/methylene tetrahydromethanopterin reductase-like flavin-dependent oxidoreductase (luciferase family)
VIPIVSTSRSHQAECYATAPQGNVTQTSHKHVTKQNQPSPNATNTLESGEAEQSAVATHTYGYDEPTDEVQRPWADAYRSAWLGTRTPRIGLSRFVFPARDRRAALAPIGEDVHRAALRFGERGTFPANLDTAAALRRFHCFYGHPDEIVAELRRERVLPVATDLITQFNPAVPDQDAAIRALELIATEVAPALGWKPALQGV